MTLGVRARVIKLLRGVSVIAVADVNKRENCPAIWQSHKRDELVFVSRTFSLATCELDDDVAARKGDGAAGRLAYRVVSGTSLETQIECAIGFARVILGDI